MAKYVEGLGMSWRVQMWVSAMALVMGSAMIACGHAPESPSVAASTVDRDENLMLTANHSTDRLVEHAAMASMAGIDINPYLGGPPPDDQGGPPPGGFGGGPGAPPPGGGRKSYKLSGTFTLDDGTSKTVESPTYESSKTDVSGVFVSNGSALTLSKPKVVTSSNTTSEENSSFYGLNAAVLANKGGRSPFPAVRLNRREAARTASSRPAVAPK